MKTLLQVNNLSKEYAAKTIFSGLSFSVMEKQKIGVIGRNGAGKSTLFRLILGDETTDNGTIIFDPMVRLGRLDQEVDWDQSETSLAYLLRISEQAEWTAKKLASRFELSDTKLALPAATLSGGWKMRLRLVAMLLRQPNLFLLDEPTNYLDLNTLLLLEQYLKSYKGSFMIISHDREFLKNTCTQTLEISSTGCYHYPGPLEEYLAFKEQKQITLIKKNEGLSSQQEHLQAFVDRFRASASRAKQAQAMLRKIEKLEAKRITIEHEAGITRIKVPPVPKRKSMALRVKKLSIGYQSPVVTNIEFDMLFGERLALLGDNGQGKTTLLKTLAEVIKPLAGSFHWHSDATLAYHAQDSQEILNRSEQVGAYLRRCASPDIKTEVVLKMAGDFLFDEEAIKKTTGVLSGGEKSRLVLAGILLSKPDILILDEPTSHLDFETVEALALALRKFAGAIIFTSHDRTFTNIIATGLLEINDGQLKKCYEDYEDYIANIEASLQLQTAAPEPDQKDTSKQDLYLAQKTHQKQLASLEKSLAKLNQRHAELMYYFTEHPTNYSVDKVRELDQLNQDIRETEDRWLEQATQ